MYSTALPSQAYLKKLISLVDYYPITRRQLDRLAKSSSLPPRVISFLAEFPQDTVFDNQADLESSLADLNIIIRQEREEPAESHSLEED